MKTLLVFVLGGVTGFIIATGMIFDIIKKSLGI